MKLELRFLEGMSYLFPFVEIQSIPKMVFPHFPFPKAAFDIVVEQNTCHALAGCRALPPHSQDVFSPIKL